MKFGLKNAGVLHKSLQTHHAPLVAKSIANGCKYFFMEEEAVHRGIPFDARYGNPCPRVTVALGTTDLDFHSLKNHLSGAAVLPVGNPRFDFLVETVPVHAERQNEIKKRFGDFYLFCSNFSLVFAPEDHSLKNLEAEGIWRSKEERDALYLYIENHRKRALKVCAWLRDLSLRKTLVYRPHPLESLEKVQSFFKGSKVQIVRDDSLIPWLKTCSQLLHSGCTSGVEFASLGRKSIFLLPLDSEKKYLPYKHSFHCTNLDEFDKVDQQSNHLPAEAIEKIRVDTFGPIISKSLGKGADNTVSAIYDELPKTKPFGLFMNCLMTAMLDIWFRYKIRKSPKEAARLMEKVYEKSQKWLELGERASGCHDDASSMNAYKLGKYCTLFKV
jgi:surface carbohydrate biosynthesis protein